MVLKKDYDKKKWILSDKGEASINEILSKLRKSIVQQLGEYMHISDPEEKFGLGTG